MSSLQLNLLGECSFLVDGEPGPHFPTDKARALLAYLALTPDRPIGRPVLAALLWPEHEEQAARANLRLTLHRLNQMLDTVDPHTGRRLLTVSRQSLQINTEFVEVDALRFDAELKAWRRIDHSALEECEFCLETSCAEQFGATAGNLLAGVKRRRRTSLRGMALP